MLRELNFAIRATIVTLNKGAMAYIPFPTSIIGSLKNGVVNPIMTSSTSNLREAHPADPAIYCCADLNSDESSFQRVEAAFTQ